MKKVGLALSGGAVHGMGHIGALAVLERAGIPIDYVAGTSVGALVGAFVAAGWPAERLHEFALKLGWRQMARPAWPGRGGLISFHLQECFVAEQLHDATFADLPRAFAAVTADLATGDLFPITSGRVAPAVRASTSVPGVVVPAEIDGRLLSDGGVACNLPVDAVRALGAEYVIAVNIFGRHWRKARSPLGRAVAGLENAIRWTGGGLRSADCVIEPDLTDFSYIRFRHQEEMIARGAAAAEAKLPEIKAALGL